MAADDNKKQKKSQDDSGGGMKSLLLYVGAMGVMTVVAIVLVVVVVGPKLSPAPMVQTQQPAEQKESLGDAKGLVNNAVALGEFIVNPAGTQMKRYLAVDISAAIASSKSSLITQHQAELMHTINATVAKKTITELQEIGGMESLRNDIKDALNEVFGEGSIEQIFFTKYIIQ